MVKMEPQPIPQIVLPALLVRGEEAAKMLGMGRSSFYKRDAQGLVPMAVRIGSARRWSVAELQVWTEAGCPPRDRWESMKREDGRHGVLSAKIQGSARRTG